MIRKTKSALLKILTSVYSEFLHMCIFGSLQGAGNGQACGALSWCIMYAHKLYHQALYHGVSPLYHGVSPLQFFFFHHTLIFIVSDILCTDAVLQLHTDFACSICKMWIRGWWGGPTITVAPNRMFLL